MKQHTHLWTGDRSLEYTIGRMLLLGATIVTIAPLIYTQSFSTEAQILTTALIIYIGELTAPI